MTSGCGIDIIKIDRIKKATQKPGFLERVLNSSEIEYVNAKTGNVCGKKVVPYATIAGLFAAKEAVAKALGTGLLKSIGFHDVEIGHTTLGAPTCVLHGKAQELLGKNATVFVSISHDGEYAIAMAKIDVLL